MAELYEIIIELLRSEYPEPGDAEEHLNNIDVEMDLLRTRLFTASNETDLIEARYGTHQGDELSLLSRARIAAVGVLFSKEDGSWELPALTIVPQLLQATTPQPLENFAPEWGIEGERLRRWYEEVLLIKVEDGTFVVNRTAFQSTKDTTAEGKVWADIVATFVTQAQLSAIPDLEVRLQTLGEAILVEDALVRRIYRSLLAGRHVVLSGPPGTGKTQLAKLLPTLFWHEAQVTTTRLGLTLEEPPVVTETYERHGYLPVVVTATEEWGCAMWWGALRPNWMHMARG